VALTIAGSDPSGGAGIQADLKTFTAIGVYGGAVISSLTVQNTRGVFGAQAVAPQLVMDQIEYVLRDLNVSHIKIGMLGSAAVVRSVCNALTDFSGEIIYDPVMESSSGRQLIDPEGHAAVKLLLEQCTVITPNLPELCRLTGLDAIPKESAQAAAERLLHQYGKLHAVIVTGGHGKPGGKTITDYLFTRANNSTSAAVQMITHPKIASSNTHGTGCTFAAAFTAYHLLTGDDSKAFKKATAYMDDLIRKSASFTVGHGTGPLMHHLR
ncbi:MAG: bifunctional hydroxymethylpyrimidine kinase/phosphomethylpyrimidine kinase, partial [Desulfobulbales bacterium]